MVFYLGPDREVRVLSSFVFSTLFTQDIAKINPFFPYDYSVISSKGKPSIAVDVSGIPITNRLKSLYKIKKFIRGT